MTNEFKRNNQRRWTTLWDRPNRRILILGARESTDMRWDFVVVDDSASIPGVYTIWRGKKGGALVAAEIRLGPDDNPLGFPDDLLSRGVLGSMTIWPYPALDSFIWWSSPAESESSSEDPATPEASQDSVVELVNWDSLPDLEQDTKMELLGYDNHDWDKAPTVQSTATLDSNGRWQFDGGRWFVDPQQQDESASHYARRIVSESHLATLWGIRVLKPNGESMTHQELYGKPHMLDR